MAIGLAAYNTPPPQPGRQPKPASLKLQFQKYSTSLFDVEAQHYGKNAQDEAELRRWLNDLAACITSEVLEECKSESSRHDFRCTASEREKAIIDGLKRRTGHWIEAAKTDPSAAMKRSSATIARLQATMAQAEGVLAELDAPKAPTQPTNEPIAIASPMPTRTSRQSRDPKPELLHGKDTVNRKEAAMALGVS